MTWPTTKNGDYLVLRTVSKDWTSRGGFKWRKRGETVAPDWNPDPARDCGGGLHGLLWGCGDAALLGSVDDVWMVVAVKPEDVANPDAPAKVRFRAGRVVRHGARDDVIAWLVDQGGRGLPVVYAHATVGDYGSATVGYRGTATAGDYGSATAGEGGIATVGYRGTATVGGYGSATAGYRGTATVGGYGSATVGGYGSATVGTWGTATAGTRGTATAGHGGVLRIAWCDGTRTRWAIGYVGEDGIEPGVAYGVNGEGKFEVAS